MPKLIGGTWYPSNAVGDLTTDDAAAIQAAIDKAGDWASSGIMADHGIQTTLALNKDGQRFDGHGRKLVCLGTISGGEIFTAGGAVAESNSKDFQEIANLVIDFNNISTHPRGVGTYNATGGLNGSDTPHDYIVKFLKLRNIAFINHNNSGKECIFVRNPENGCDISDIYIPSLSANTIGIHIIDQGPTATTSLANHGNIDIRRCRISLSASNTVGYKFESTRTGVSDDHALNRVKCSNLQAFRASKADNDGTIGYYVAPGDSGGTFNNRHFFFSQITAEDLMTAFLFQKSGSAGVFGVDLSQFGFEDKQSSGWTTPRTAIKLASSGIVANIHDGQIIAQPTTGPSDGTGTPSVSLGMDVSGVGSTNSVNINNVSFYRKTGSGIFSRLTGHVGKQGVVIKNCEGYNPVSFRTLDGSLDTVWTAMTRPWAKSGNSDKGIYNPKDANWYGGSVGAVFGELWNSTDGQATPVSGTTYQIFNSPKWIVIKEGAATITALSRNGVDIFDSAVSNYQMTLDVFETFSITYTGTLNTASVYCL